MPSFRARIQDPRRLRACAARERVEAGCAEFFESRGFRRVRTPLLATCPGMETHIRTFAVDRQGDRSGEGGRAFLPTSPEFAMKKLLVGGLERIYQICPAFRDEPVSSTHLPEFTMLEWYRANADLEAILADSEQLFHRLAGCDAVEFQGRRISLTPPWPRLRVADLFREHAGVDLTSPDSGRALARACGVAGEWDELFFRVWLNQVEPKLPPDRAVFVVDYPPSQRALAQVARGADGHPWARRFEIYAGGLELGNAFEELTDPVEQRRRFEEDMRERERLYGPGFPRTEPDAEFLRALEEGMPPSAGIAVGLDRVIMLLCDEPEIGYTFWLPSGSG